jgi:hypothetical protein
MSHIITVYDKGVPAHYPVETVEDLSLIILSLISGGIEHYTIKLNYAVVNFDEVVLLFCHDPHFNVDDLPIECTTVRGIESYINWLGATQFAFTLSEQQTS